MTDNPIRRATRESADLTARLWRKGIDRAITDAVQENEMNMDEYVTMKNAEEAERQIAEACLDAGMVGREVEIIAAIRADERTTPFTYEQVVAARGAFQRRMRRNPASWQSHDAREEDAILEALEAAQAARLVDALNTEHPEDQEG